MRLRLALRFRSVLLEGLPFPLHAAQLVLRQPRLLLWQPLAALHQRRPLLRQRRLRHLCTL